MVGRDTPEPNARGDHVRPRTVQATVSEPRIPRIYPWGVSNIARKKIHFQGRYVRKCKQARGKPDKTRNIPRKGYICRPSVAGDGGGTENLDCRSK